VEDILATLPMTGGFFPYLQTIRAGDRATEFKQSCVGLSIQGVSLLSYRYAWAERAKTVGYPERFAQLALLPENRRARSVRLPKCNICVNLRSMVI
jgi:hypothetical protein